MRSRDECASDSLSQAWGLRRFRQDDLAPLLRVNQREPRAFESEHVVRREEVILVIPVLRDPQRSSNALDPRSSGVVETDELTGFEVELGAIKPDVHGHLPLLRSAPAAQAPRVEIRRHEKPDEAAPYGVRQETQSDPVPRYPAMLRKLDVHGPSFHNALSACSSLLDRQRDSRSIDE